MLRLILGTDWIAVRDEILERIASDVATQQGNRIYMVPELISHDTERRLCYAAGDTASRFAEVLSFTRLARRVAEQTGTAAQECLDNGGRLVTMACAARQLHSRLKVYSAVETKPDFLASVVEAMDEFKRCCIRPEDLSQAADLTDGVLAQKLEELALLLECYDSLCSRGKRDPRDRETLLLEQMEDSDFASRHVFYIDGFPDFTRQHLAILEHLIRHSPEVTVGLTCDRPDSKAMAFEKAGITATQLIKCARQAGVEVKLETVAGRGDDLTAACLALFQGPAPAVSGNVHALRAETLIDEVTAAAEQVISLVRGGARYREIGITCADMGAYQNSVDLVFHKCNIPIYRAGNEDILQKTAVFTVVSALEAALGGFEQRDVLRYVKSMLSPLEQDLCDQVENYAVTWGVRGNAWCREWKNHPDGLGQRMTEAVQERLIRLNEARRLAVDALVRLRDGFAVARNLSQQVQALYAFLEEIRLGQKLSELADMLDREGNNREAQTLNQLWEILLSAMEQLHDALGETVWEPEHFTRLFSMLLSQYEVGTIPPVLDAVTVGPVNAQRCQQVKHLIVLGANEGALPGYGGSTGLLSDQERVVLRNVGVPLTGGAMEGIQAEFAEIYGVFCGATQSITVYSSGSQPSYIFRRLAQMTGGEQPVKPSLGAALSDAEAAAAYLAGLQAVDTAVQLGLQDAYWNVRTKAEYEIGTISRENVVSLYGSQLNLSASQVDCQAQCRMSYFLKYGLRARERREADVDPAEFGTYVHAVLEKTARKVMEMGGFREVSLEQTMDIAMEYSRQYGLERFAELDSQRLSYLFHRNRRELEMVVAELWRELRSSRFVPDDFELRFGEGGRMPAIEIPGGSLPAVLRGFVDRVDIWNEDGRNYFRVVDYKTGKKDFDYCDVFNGVGLQLLLYLFALEHGLYGSAAGVQYFPARATLLRSEGKLTEEEAEHKRRSEWKRKGLLLRDEDVLDAMDPDEWHSLCVERKRDGTFSGDLADREQMKMLRQYVFSYLAGMVNEIASGSVSANPYTRGSSHDACSYCPYSSVCHKQSITERRNFKRMSAEEFWDGVERKVSRRG